MTDETSAGRPPVAPSLEAGGMPEIEGDLPFFEGAVVSEALGRR